MTNYELIVCIINTGFTDTVMAAAKEKGAKGGTVFHARGTANQEAEEFFHITVQPDKEIVLILVPSDIRDDVLHAVYNAAGLKTPGQGISFSMPVTNTVGLWEGDDSEFATALSNAAKESEQTATDDTTGNVPDDTTNGNE